MFYFVLNKLLLKGDKEKYDTCAICIEDFEEGDLLRILPCNHGLLLFLTCFITNLIIFV